MTRLASGPTESWLWHDERRQVDVGVDNGIGGRAVRTARILSGVVAAVLAGATSSLVAGCSSETVVDTGEWATITPMESVAATPSPPPVDPAHLVNPADYVAHPNYQEGYYFTTPSGRWNCGIIARTWAGCQAASGELGVAGAPATVPTPNGGEAPPNAIVIDPQGDARFVAFDRPEFTLTTGPANVLPFNRTLVAAGFRCNIQEQFGVACMSDQSGKSFSFSADGMVPQYTEVPVGAP